MTEKKKTIGRYQVKARQGMVPTQYDRSSKNFNLGAHRHWADKPDSLVARLVAVDRDFLERTRRN